MDIETPVVPEVTTEVTAPSEAMDSMTAGYNKQRGIETEPVVVAETPVEEVEVAVELPPPPSVDDRIAELTTQVGQMRETPTQIAKLHGKIGELNRTIQQLQQAGGAAGEVSADVTKALAEAEAVAADFPELAGPLVNVMKALSAHRPPAAAAVAAPDFKAMLAEARASDAMEILSDDHPDWQALRDSPTPEYKSWLESKDEAWRSRYFGSSNPLFISKQLTEFKTWRDTAQAAQEKKTKRLEGAITPKGEGTPTTSTLPDSAGLTAGYNKVRRLRTA